MRARLVIASSFLVGSGFLLAFGCSRVDEPKNPSDAAENRAVVGDAGASVQHLSITGGTWTGTGNIGTPSQWGPGYAPEERDASILKDDQQSRGSKP